MNAAVAAGDGDDRQHAVAALGGRQRRGQRARAADLDLRDLAGVHHRRLGGVQRAVEGLRVAAAGDLLHRRVGAPAHRRAPAGGADAVDRRLHDDLEHADAVQAARERLAHAADRLLQAPALALRRSSSRASSWRAIELNSLPSAANSSLPSAGTLDAEVAAAEALRGGAAAAGPRPAASG